MVVVYTDLINMMIPVLAIAIPAFIAYGYLQSRVGFMAGAIIGIAVARSTTPPLVDNWVVILGILMLASIIFIDNRSVIKLRGG